MLRRLTLASRRAWIPAVVAAGNPAPAGTKAGLRLFELHVTFSKRNRLCDTEDAMHRRGRGGVCLLLAATQLVGQGSGEKPKCQMRVFSCALELAYSRGFAHNKNSKAGGAGVQFRGLACMQRCGDKQASLLIGCSVYPVLLRDLIQVCPLLAMLCKAVFLPSRDARPRCTRGFRPGDTCMSAPRKAVCPCVFGFPSSPQFKLRSI